jgi:hypothetical protein
MITSKVMKKEKWATKIPGTKISNVKTEPVLGAIWVLMWLDNPTTKNSWAGSRDSAFTDKLRFAVYTLFFVETGF